MPYYRWIGLGVAALFGMVGSALAGTPDHYGPAVLADNPVIYYRFEETDNTQPALNEGWAGTVANGTYSNVTLGQPTPFRWQLKTCGSYNGLSSSVTMPAGIAGMMVGTGDFSVELWYRADATTRGDLFSNVSSDRSHDFTISSDYNGAASGLWVYDHTPDSELLKMAPARNGNWHYVVVTRSSGYYDVYIDTLKTSLGAKTGITVPPGIPITDFNKADYGGAKLIGANSSPVTVVNFSGCIDEFAFYDKALSQADLIDHYQVAGGLVPLPPLPGDANLDGTVDGTDLNAVLSNYNRSGMGWSQGDFNNDGTVDGTDLNAVLSNYNRSAGVTAAVPEPGTLGMLALGALGVLAWKGRRKRK
jgi:hypothetical protein